MLELLRAAPVERAMHRLCVKLGRAALAACHRRHAWRVHVGQDGHPDIKEGDVIARVARRGPQGYACRSSASRGACRSGGTTALRRRAARLAPVAARRG
eukprot:scaffold59554_cov33-Phaeocystis_antarctica.AAC.1